MSNFILNEMDPNTDVIVKKEVFDEDFLEITENEIFQPQIDFKIKTEETNSTYEEVNHEDFLNNLINNNREKCTKLYPTCLICSELFNSEFELSQHNLKHVTVQINRIYECDHCSYCHNEKHNLRFHRRLTHPDAVGKRRKHERKKKRKSSNKKTALYECTVCSKIMPYRRWHEHITQVHPLDPTEYACNKCSMTFKCRRYLNKHLNKHSGNSQTKTSKQTAKCDQCAKIFKSRVNLQIHKKTVHSKEDHECDLCPAKFKCKTYLLTHKSRVHYDDGKTHKCETCDKEFRSPRDVRIHVTNNHVRSR